MSAAPSRDFLPVRRRLARAAHASGDVTAADVAVVCSGFVHQGSKLDGALLLAALAQAAGTARDHPTALLRVCLAALAEAGESDDARTALVRRRVEHALAGIGPAPARSSDHRALAALHAVLVADRLRRDRGERTLWRAWTLVNALPVASAAAPLPRWPGLSPDLHDGTVEAAVAASRQSELAKTILEHFRARRLPAGRAARWLRRLWQTSKTPWRRPPGEHHHATAPIEDAGRSP